jgi:hypothetical protein
MTLDSVVTKQTESLSSLILIGELIFKIADTRMERQTNNSSGLLSFLDEPSLWDLHFVYKQWWTKSKALIFWETVKVL